MYLHTFTFCTSYYKKNISNKRIHTYQSNFFYCSWSDGGDARHVERLGVVPRLRDEDEEGAAVSPGGGARAAAHRAEAAGTDEVSLSFSPNSVMCDRALTFEL